MNKVKCVNGHFFDLDKYNPCPVCGGGVGTNSMEKGNGGSLFSRSIRNSILIKKEDKTEILQEEKSNPEVPGKGKAGGIVWNFTSQQQNTGKPGTSNGQKNGETHIQNVDTVPDDVPDSRDSEEKGTIPESKGTSKISSNLTQAVANTGHGITSALPKTVAYYDQFTEVVPPTGWLVCVKGAHKGQAFQCKENKNRIGRNEDYTIAPMEELSISREIHATLYFDPKYRKFYLNDGDGDGLVRVNDEILCGKTELKAYDMIELGQAEFVFIPLCGERFSWDDYKN